MDLPVQALSLSATENRLRAVIGPVLRFSMVPSRIAMNHHSTSVSP